MDLALKSGVGLRTVGAVEAGKSVRVATLRCLAAALGVDKLSREQCGD